MNYSVDCGPVQQVAMMWMGQDMYRGAIPGQVPGSRITYSITATDMAGNSATSPEHTFAVIDLGLGDFDFDGGVDLFDLALFGNCYSGESNPLGLFCVRADFDGDCDSDLSDFAGFHAKFVK